MDRLSSHRATKDVVEKHGFKFSKSLGQNFLIDDNVIDRILQGARLSQGDKIIEVGPGIGTLTREMGKVADKVVAIEIDKTLIPILRETLCEFDNIEVVNQDILKVDVEQLVKEKLDKGPVKLVANLPYYITTPIVMKFLEEDIPVTDIVVMVQKEVADRMNAKPSTKDYGAFATISVLNSVTLSVLQVKTFITSHFLSIRCKRTGKNKSIPIYAIFIKFSLYFL